MGDVSVNWLQTVFVLAAAFLAVFWEAAFGGVRHLLGAQIDLLPALMVYAGLFSGITTVTLLAVCGGLWFDSLSANPLGVSMLPLFVVGLVIHVKRDLILRDHVRPGGAGLWGERGDAGADLAIAADHASCAAARLGNAVATGGHECGRRDRDADLLRAVQLVKSHAGPSPRRGNQLPRRPGNTARKRLKAKCLFSTN